MIELTNVIFGNGAVHNDGDGNAHDDGYELTMKQNGTIIRAPGKNA